ncbi:MAG: hypothetical protein VYA84_04095 [Planctomycetota bacterium]|nr:hypothetical protein [Planctomycetota bacterium]
MASTRVAESMGMVVVDSMNAAERGVELGSWIRCVAFDRDP